MKDDIPYVTFGVTGIALQLMTSRSTFRLVTNDEADQDGDDDNDVIPAAAGESAEVEGEHHHGAFDFGPPGGAGPVRPQLRKYQ